MTNRLYYEDRVSGPGSIGLISDQPSVNTAVVFVHGFLGNPRTTWINFQGLVDEFAVECPWWPNSDLFFFKYDSVGSAIQTASERLSRYLEGIYPAPLSNDDGNSDGRLLTFSRGWGAGRRGIRVWSWWAIQKALSSFVKWSFKQCGFSCLFARGWL